MEKIASFLVDHDKLLPGLYTSRIDGDITTYDMRFIKPNNPPFMDIAAMHTLEHLYATLLRNSAFGSKIVYFGPMGCRTGFYLLTRSMTNREVIELLIDTTLEISQWSSAIPGAAASAECGNWLEHDLEGAKKLAERYHSVIRKWTLDMLSYDNE